MFINPLTSANDFPAKEAAINPLPSIFKSALNFLANAFTIPFLLSSTLMMYLSSAAWAVNADVTAMAIIEFVNLEIFIDAPAVYVVNNLLLFFCC